MKEYEFIREIFNNCSGNQMRDVFISEIETDDIESIVHEYVVESKTDIQTFEPYAGTVIYEIETAGLRQRLTFTEL